MKWSLRYFEDGEDIKVAFWDTSQALVSRIDRNPESVPPSSSTLFLPTFYWNFDYSTDCWCTRTFPCLCSVCPLNLYAFAPLFQFLQLELIVPFSVDDTSVVTYFLIAVFLSGLKIPNTMSYSSCSPWFCFMHFYL